MKIVLWCFVMYISDELNMVEIAQPLIFHNNVSCWPISRREWKDIPDNITVTSHECPGWHQRTNRSFAVLFLCEGIHRSQVDFPRKAFPCHDVITECDNIMDTLQDTQHGTEYINPVEWVITWSITWIVQWVDYENKTDDNHLESIDWARNYHT